VTTLSMDARAAFSVAVAAAASGQTRMVPAIARVSSWLTKRTATPSIPPGLVVDDRVTNLSPGALMSPEFDA
jgi:hypothetical protein